MKKKITKNIDALKKKSGLNRLQRREKRVLAVGLLFVIGFLVVHFCLLPYIDARNSLADSLKRKEADLVDIQLLKREYLELKSRQGDIENRLMKRTAGFSLFSFLEEQAAAVKVKDRVTYMKPSSNMIEEGFNESIVEMKIETITLQQLVDFLVKIESEKMVVVVQRISIQENSRENGMLDTVVRIKTYEMEQT